MKREHIKYFVCPECKSELIISSEEDREDIQNGILLCPNKHQFKIKLGIPRFLMEMEESMKKTQESFSQKWATKSVSSYGLSGPVWEFHHEWYLKRYGWESEDNFAKFLNQQKFILDAGCGVGRDLKWFASHSKGLVFGIDISDSIDEAKNNLQDLDNVVLVQGDISKLPFREDFFDFISCDLVIHHTPNTKQTFEHLVKHTKKEGIFATYTYRVKGPIREFCDNFIREKTTKMSYEDCYNFSKGMTLLGKAFADLKATVNVPEDIPLLQIKKGEIDVQRFLYWNIFKCFWNEEHGLETSIMTNFDWYHPTDAHRHSPHELKNWAAEANVEILYFDIGDPGISIRVKK